MEPTAQSTAFTAPHAPHESHAAVESHAPVAPRDNDRYLATALQLAAKEAAHAYSSRKWNAETPWEDFISEIEDDVTENLVDADLLGELRSRLHATNWWMLLPSKAVI